MDDATDQPTAPPRGRPRDSTIDQRVLAETRAMLIEEGWNGTTVRGIARRANISRPAISRRWPSKAHLVLHAILGPEPDLSPFTGADRAGWVDAVIDGSFELLLRPEVRAAVPGLLAAIRDHDDLRVALWENFSGPAIRLFADLPDADGPGSIDAQAIIVAAAGAALFCSLITSGDAQERVADQLRLLLTRAPSPPSVPTPASENP